MDLSKDYDFIERSSQLGLKSILHATLNKFSISNAEIFFHTEELVKKANDRKINHPLCYKKKEIGLLEVPISDELSYPDSTKFPDVCKTINLLVNRYITNKNLHNFLGETEELIGESQYLLDIEDFIEKSANSNYPVIIKGPSGSEQLAVASAIHCYGERHNMPFKEINCTISDDEEFQNSLLVSIKEVKKGTIYFSNVEKLTPKQQKIFANYLSTKSFDLNQENRNDIRYIASSSCDLSIKVLDNQFSEKIFSTLNILSIEIPKLENRKEDIPHIINYFINERGFTNKKFFTIEAINLLKSYNWPGNYHELERTIIQLLILSEKNSIDTEDINKIFPNIVSKANNISEKNNKLVIDLLLKRKDSYNHCHMGLKRSLDYIADNYNHDVNLSILAEKAFVSPSHLSYLFRHHLGKSFKQILSELRVERVKQIFANEPTKKITVAALEVGFGDLSHFEKIFKRQTNMTPREYRKSIRTSHSSLN
ncbi:AraC family transcriptional regulator [Marinomonas agarivorans]|nr:AraC family transcriptional regulator [Marinomonas agarivorans]